MATVTKTTDWPLDRVRRDLPSPALEKQKKRMRAKADLYARHYDSTASTAPAKKETASKSDGKATLAGIRARTPKTTAMYDEPSANERRLRGVAKRTPKKTMVMDEKYVKESPPKRTSSERKAGVRKVSGKASGKSGGKTSAPAMTNIDRKPKASGVSPDESDFNTKLHEAVGKAGPGRTEEAKAAPAKTETTAAPKRAAAVVHHRSTKKRSKLRRAVGAVGRGIRAVGRGVRRVVAGKRRRKQMGKRTS